MTLEMCRINGCSLKVDLFTCKKQEIEINKIIPITIVLKNKTIINMTKMCNSFILKISVAMRN